MPKYIVSILYSVYSVYIYRERDRVCIYIYSIQLCTTIMGARPVPFLGQNRECGL